MNRKQRRAAPKQRPSAGGHRAGTGGDPAGLLFAEAARLQRDNKLNDAARVYKRLLLLQPDHAEASNNLGLVLHAQGKLSEASACFARALALRPQLFSPFAGVCATLAAVNPAIGQAMARAMPAWPARLPAARLLDGASLDALAADPLLLCILQSTVVRNLALECALTALRAHLLGVALGAAPATAGELTLCCAIARQCFINEYVFATAADEESNVAALKARLTGAAAAPMALAALAMYLPLHALPDAAALLERDWPAPLAAVLTQQLREPQAERALAGTIPRLTAIDDGVSLRVQQQYEENPYPRWLGVAGGVEPAAIDQSLRDMFPAAPFTALGKTADLDYLVAGCGTGWHATGIAQKYLGARLLAIDLSLSSLCYAKRNTPPPLSERIEYAQADILKLSQIGRSFDVIDASGVLHHMADPFTGWRALIPLLRPNGLMHLGFYSELGRREIVAARAIIAERKLGASPEEIRRCRQDLLQTPLARLARYDDFYSMSECRDLLFHVQESRLTIPQIRDFIAANGLRFIGFEFMPPALQQLRDLFAANGWSMTDLDKWHAVETQYPDTFAGMYHLWVQKN
jgi:2-polyprenyl-3-methyl-5-hydroxy-6-metoxy-1,4-benzoquinol methylase/tetratricopeptide (TPR) repeat protein